MKEKSVKYRCKKCGSSFLVTDSEVLENRRQRFRNVFAAEICCPLCGYGLVLKDSQLARVRKYERNQ